MKKLLIILFFGFFLKSYAQEGNVYKPDVAWKTIIDSVTYLAPDTFLIKADPIDFNDPGAINREFGNYLIDNVGHIYTIIDSTATTITLVDEFDYNIAPVAGAIGYVFNSVGNASAPYVAPVVYEFLDSKAKDNADKLFKDILWKHGNEIPFDSMRLDTGHIITELEPVGTMFWDSDNMTFSGVLENDVVGQFFQELYVLVKNETGSTIDDGDPVMYAGTVGASGKVKGQLAIADGSLPPNYMLGLATQEIENNEWGYVTTYGRVRGIDASGTPYSEAWTEGEIIYVDTVAGDLTNVQPEAPNYSISIGVVGDNSSTHGELIVRPTWNEKITDAADVDGTELTTTGQILVWDNDSSYFDPNYNILDYLRIEDYADSISNNVATITEAQAGENNTKIMTPLRVAEQLELNAVPYIGAQEDIYTDYNISADSIFPNYVDGYLPDSIWNNINSAARLWGGIITDNSDGTVSIGAGAGIIKTDEAGPEATPTALNQGQGSELTYVSWDAVASLSLTNNAYNYIFLDGTDSTMKATTNFYSISFTQDFTVGRVYRTDNDVVVRLCGTNSWNFNRRVQLFGEEVFPIIRGFGLIISETGTLQFDITEGVLWAEAVNRFSVDAFDGDTASFTYWYRDGLGDFTEVPDSTQIDALNYDDNSGTLQELTANRYGVHWVYMVHDGNVHVVYGRGNYTLSDAETAPIPLDIPGLLDSYATLIGKIVVQKNDTEFTSIVSAFTETLTNFETITDHNSLGGLDGGEAGYYGHLTSTDKARLDDWKDSINVNETDPIYAADSANIVWFSDTVSVIGTKYDIDTLSTGLYDEVSILNDSIDAHRIDIDLNADSIAAHRIDIDLNTDSIAAHRVEIDALIDTAAIHLDTLQAHNVRLIDLEGFAADSGNIIYDTDIISEQDTGVSRLATITETQVGENNEYLITPLRNAEDLEINAVPYYGVKEDIYSDYNITADSVFSSNIYEPIENETPSGTINGTNDTFTTAYEFETNSTEVFLNGVKQILGVMYTEGTGEIIFEAGYIPETGDYLRINYRK